MCYGCWEEYGKPLVVNETTAKTAELVKRLYEFAAAGGNCHIVTDDWNLEDDHIEFCVAQVERGGYVDPNYADDRDSPEQLSLEAEILKAFGAMTMDERASTMAIVDGFHLLALN